MTCKSTERPAGGKTEASWLRRRMALRTAAWVLAAEAAWIALWALAGYRRLPSWAALQAAEEPRPPSRFLLDKAPDAARHAWGFNFEPSLVPRAEILHFGPRKDEIPALVDPPFTEPAAQPRFHASARVVGVAVGGEARAYPLTMLDVHECINDTLGGVPIAVTRNPLGSTVCVYDRRAGGETLVFGVSGLLWRSNTVLYDRRLDPHDESLWSQLSGRAIAGPAAARGLTLERIDADLTSWRDWRRRHPNTTLLAPQTGFGADYDASEFETYYRRTTLLMPIDGLSARRPDLPLKAPLVVVRAGGAERAYPLGDLARTPERALRDALGGVNVALTLDAPTSRVLVQALDPGAPPPVRYYAYWFAWDLIFPEGDLLAPSAATAHAGNGAN